MMPKIGQGRGRSDGSFYFGFGGVIASHGVDRDCQHGRGGPIGNRPQVGNLPHGGLERCCDFRLQQSPALLFGNLDDFAAFVLSAMRTDAVRELGLMATGALRQDGAG